jgi:hypothetical protein
LLGWLVVPVESPSYSQIEKCNGGHLDAKVHRLIVSWLMVSRRTNATACHRRHLTPSQAAMVVARARDCYYNQAKERQKARKGNQPGASPVNLPDLSKGDSRDHVARVVGVSGKSID